MIFIALGVNVLAYLGLITMFPNRACKKIIRPEFITPQLFLDLWATPEYLSCRYVLQHPQNLRHTVCQYQLDQKMDMVFVPRYLQKLHLVAILNFQTYHFQNLINLAVKHCSLILCRKYQVLRSTVTL